MPGTPHFLRDAQTISGEYASLFEDRSIFYAVSQDIVNLAYSGILTLFCERIPGSIKRGGTALPSAPIANRLRQNRKRAGLTLALVAEELDVGIATVSRWETRRQAVPDTKKALLAALYGEPVDRLFEFEEAS